MMGNEARQLFWVDVCTRPDSLLFTLASPHCQSVNLHPVFCISMKPQMTYWTRSGQCSPLSDPRQGTTPALFALMSTSTPVLVYRRARLTSWQLFVHHVIIVLGSFSKSWIWNGDLSSPTQVSWYARPSRLQYLLHQEIQETQKRILTWQLWFWKRWYGKPMLSASSTDEEDAQFQRLRIKRWQSLEKRWQRSVLVSAVADLMLWVMTDIITLTSGHSYKIDIHSRISENEMPRREVLKG